MIKKNTVSDSFKLIKTYYSWLAFASIIFILTHAISSLDIARAYRFQVLDVILTFGFLLFIGMVEIIIPTLLIVILHLAIQQIFKKNPSPIFRLFILAWFAISWLNLLLLILNKPVM